MFVRQCVVRLAGVGVAAAVGVGSAGTAARAETAQFTQPALDRWMYPFSGTGSNGARGTASTFGAVGSPGFDNRDAQFLVGFNTAGSVPAGLGSANYLITAARLRIVDSQGTYPYDDSYDPVASYATGAADDAGRPLEVHGVGFRNGYTRLAFGPNDNAPPGFEEATAFSTTAPQPAARTRSAFPVGFDPAGQPRDVSNNVADGFESAPWAVGRATPTLTAGATVPADTAFTFDLNVSDPFVRQYLQDALDAGAVGLTVTSMHSATQQSSEGVPQFYNKENAAHRPDLNSFVAPQLELTYTLVPEPSAATAALGFAAAGLLARRRGRRE